MDRILYFILNNKDEIITIIAITLKMAFFSTTISSLIGIILACFIAFNDFFFKKIIIRITRTLMGLPPVVAGLFIFMLLSRSGIFGFLNMLYTIKAMVIAQITLITPIIMGQTITTLERYYVKIIKTTKGIGLSKMQSVRYVIFECRKELICIILLGFGRAMSEVGAIQLVGGNIQNKTRVMTTAIMLETNKGNFDLAISLGIILLIIEFLINILIIPLEKNRQK